MKKILLMFTLATFMLAGCKKENPVASTVKRVSIPEVTVLMEEQYIGALGGDFNNAIERIDGIVGYAVDTVYGFDVDGINVDTLFFTDPSWGGDTLLPGIVSLDLIATNAAGYSAVGSSQFLVLDPPTDPYPEDISGNYVNGGGVLVTVVEKVVDGVYLLYNPIFSTNLAWLDTYCIVYHSESTGLDFVDQATGFPGFGTFTYSNESYDAATKTICADMYRIEDGLALSRCTRHQ